MLTVLQLEKLKYLGEVDKAIKHFWMMMISKVKS
jgi:hypothetical protein